MTRKHKHHGRVHCPRCHTLLTNANRIPKNLLQAIITPNAKRYRCDICRLKFTINHPEKKAGHKQPQKRLSTPKEKAPKTVAASRMKPKLRSSKRRQPAAPVRKTAATQQHSAATPRRTALTHSPKPVAKKTNGNIDARVNRHLRAELQRLRKIEKKYRQLKKANRYLARACRRNQSNRNPTTKRPPSATP